MKLTWTGARANRNSSRPSAVIILPSRPRGTVNPLSSVVFRWYRTVLSLRSIPRTSSDREIAVDSRDPADSLRTLSIEMIFEYRDDLRFGVECFFLEQGKLSLS